MSTLIITLSCLIISLFIAQLKLNKLTDKFQFIEQFKITAPVEVL